MIFGAKTQSNQAAPVMDTGIGTMDDSMPLTHPPVAPRQSDDSGGGIMLQQSMGETGDGMTLSTTASIKKCNVIPTDDDNFDESNAGEDATLISLSSAESASDVLKMDVSDELSVISLSSSDELDGEEVSLRGNDKLATDHRQNHTITRTKDATSDQSATATRISSSSSSSASEGTLEDGIVAPSPTSTPPSDPNHGCVWNNDDSFVEQQNAAPGRSSFLLDSSIGSEYLESTSVVSHSPNKVPPAVFASTSTNTCMMLHITEGSDSSDQDVTMGNDDEGVLSMAEAGDIGVLSKDGLPLSRKHDLNDDPQTDPCDSGHSPNSIAQDNNLLFMVADKGLTMVIDDSQIFCDSDVDQTPLKDSFLSLSSSEEGAEPETIPIADEDSDKAGTCLYDNRSWRENDENMMTSESNLQRTAKRVANDSKVYRWIVTNKRDLTFLGIFLGLFLGFVLSIGYGAGLFVKES